MIVNGKEMDVKEGTSINELIISFDLDPAKIVIQLNGDIVDRVNYDGTTLSANDKLEIVSFVGGG